MEPKKTENRKPIIITAAMIAVVCIAAAAVIFAKGGSAEKKLEEEVSLEKEVSAEEAAAADNEIAAIADASVGDIVYFGSYEQDNNLKNGTEPVAWYVLDKADGEATLLSVYLLDRRQYHENNISITWEDCILRSWLNDRFYNMAFSEKEQAAIVNANIVNEDNPYYGTKGGFDTADKVWLLSLGEAMRYFHIDMDVWVDYINGNMDWYEYAIYCYGQDNRVCAKPTVYAAARGAYAYSEENAQGDTDYSGYDMSYAVGSGWWWLRSPGNYAISAAGIYYCGDVRSLGSYVSNDGGVRPALKVAY